MLVTKTAKFVTNIVVRSSNLELKLKSLESITMPGLSRYVKAFMGVLTAFFLFMTGCLQF